MSVLFCATYFNSAIIVQMDTDNSPQSDNNVDIDVTNDEGQDISNSDKIFDITSDMDIKPFKENVEGDYTESTSIPQNIPIPKTNIYTNPDNSTIKQPSAINTPKIPPENTVPSIKTMSMAEETAFKTDIPKREPVQTEDKKDNPFIKPIRTYEGDVAELLSRKKTSTVSMIIAENKRDSGTDSIGESEYSNNTQEGSSAGKKMAVVLLSLVLILAGIGGAYYLFMKSPLAPATPIITVEKINSLISNDSQVLIAIDNLSSKEIQNKIKNEFNKNQEFETIKEIVFTKTENNIKSRVSGPEILEIMNIKPPDILERSLTDDWMFGIYVDENGAKDIFLIFTTNYFQNAFAGMLQWEKVMADDIKQYLYYQSAPKGIANVATSTSTTTESVSSSSNINSNFTIRGNFEDRIVRNKDERAFRTFDGDILFLYSFIDNKKLVFTTKEAALNEILRKVEKEGFVR